MDIMDSVNSRRARWTPSRFRGILAPDFFGFFRMRASMVTTGRKMGRMELRSLVNWKRFILVDNLTGWGGRRVVVLMRCP